MSVLITGSGHLATRIRALATTRGHDPVPWHDPGLTSSDTPRFEAIRSTLAGLGVGTLSGAILVEESDERNLELVIALMSMGSPLPIVVSMFNENIAPHLRSAHPNLRIMNPARIAAPRFVAALDEPLDRAVRYEPAPLAAPRPRDRMDRLIVGLVTTFAAVVLAAITYFHFAERLSWLDAAYFVVVTVATVGYGDVALIRSSAASKLVGIGLILASTVFIWMIFSLTVDHIIRRRVQMALGRRRHLQRGHVILCGAGRLGLMVGEALLRRGESVLVVESNEHSESLKRLRSLGADVYVGDARLVSVLDDVGVGRAKALYSLIANDFVNLEIGLNARTLDPRLRLILRIFDDTMAHRIKEQLNIHLSLSMSAIADEKFLDAIGEPAPVS